MKGKNRRGFLISIVTIFAVIFAVLIGINIYNAPARRLAEQLNLGNRYLEEMDYEQAVVAFTNAIEIDPMNADAYIGAAEAYVGLGEPERAEEILAQGMERISDVRLEEKWKEIENELDRIKKEEEERHLAEQAARKEAEEKRKLEAALKPLYEKLEAGEEDEDIVEYFWNENLMEVEGAYSPTGDVENGIVLDVQKTKDIEGVEVSCFFYGEKTGGSYETTGKWYAVRGDDNESGIIAYEKYDGEWKNGMPNGRGEEIWVYDGGIGNEKCIYKAEIISNYKNGYKDGNVQETYYMDIFDWLDGNDLYKLETKYRVENKKIVVGSHEFNYYHDDGSEQGWMEDKGRDGKNASVIPGPWITE